MDKSNFKRRTAEIAYNVIFGAKRHFSSYDLVEKFPTYFGVVTSIVGIGSLAYPILGSKFISFALTGIGAGVVYLSLYSTHEKEKYIAVGKELTEKYNQLRSIYEKVDAASATEVVTLESEVNTINQEFQNISIHKQVFVSDIFAHYKLFGEAQSKWLVEALGLTLWKDMIPFSVKFVLAVCLIVAAVCIICNLPALQDAFSCIGGHVGN